MNKFVVIPFVKYENLLRHTAAKEPDVDNSSEPMKIDNILQIIPKCARTKARALLCILQDHLEWCATGEIVSNGITIQGSHIADLVKFTVVKHFKRKPPIGSDTYFTLLSNINVPKSLVVNDIAGGKPDVNNDVVINPTANTDWHTLTT